MLNENITVPVTVLPDAGVAAPAFGKQISNWLSFRQGGTKANTLKCAFILRKVDKKAAARAFEALVRKHESLRTIFRETEVGIEQVVVPYTEQLHQLVHAIYENRSAFARKKKYVDKRIQRALTDLGRGPLFRALLYEIKGEGFLFEFIIHHILADDWSLKLIKKEMLDAYRAESVKGALPLEPLGVQLREYAVVHQAEAKDGRIRQYWYGKLANLNKDRVLLQNFYTAYNNAVNTAAGRSIFKPRWPVSSATILNAVRKGHGYTFTTVASEQLKLRIERLSAHYRTTLSMIVLSSFFVFLRYAMRIRKPLIISRLNGRFVPSSHGIIGNFTCAAYNSVDLGSALEIEKIIKVVERDFAESLDYAVYNPRLVGDIPLTTGSQLCVNILFREEDDPEHTDGRSGSAARETYFPLENTVVVTATRITFHWAYNVLLFRKSMVEFFGREHLNVLQNMTALVPTEPVR